MDDWRRVIEHLVANARSWIDEATQRPVRLAGWTLVAIVLATGLIAVARRRSARGKPASKPASGGSGRPASEHAGARLGSDTRNHRWQVVTRPVASALLHEFSGHLGRVAGALEMTDGRILSWSDDSSIRIWTRGGQLLRRLDGHVNPVRKCCVLANGSILSWGQDWMPRLWSSDGDLIKPLQGHEAAVIGMIELADRRLLSWSGDKTLRIWSEQGAPIAVLKGHLTEVFDCTPLPNGDLLSRGGDDTIRIWSGDGDCKGVLERPGGFVKTVLPDGTVLLGAGDTTLRLARGADGAYSFSEEEGGRIIPLEDGRCVAGTYTTELDVWSGNGDVYRLLRAREGATMKDAKPAFADRIVSWDHDRSLRLWSASGAPERLQTLGQAVEGVLVTADGRMVSWGDANTLRVWSVDLEPQQLLHGHKGRVLGALPASDGSVLSWSADASLCKWAIDGAGPPGVGMHEDRILEGRAIAGGRLVTRGADNTMRLWSRTGEPIKVMNGRFAGVMEIAHDRLVAWGAYSPMTLWTLEGEPIRAIDEPASSFSEAAVLRDGRIVSWGGNQFEIRIWSTDGALLHTLAGHRLAIKSLVELENGTIVSGSSADNTIRIWSSDGKSLRVVNVEGLKGLLAAAGSRFVCWTYGGSLQFISSNGDALAVLPNTWVEGAIALRNGTVLTYGSDNTVRIYSSAGKLQRSFEATDKGARVGEVLERDNGDLLIRAGGTGTRSWSPGGTLRRSIGVFDGAIAFEDATTLLWSKNGRTLLLSGDGKDLSDWTFPDAPLSAVVKGTDRDTAWFVHSNAATLATFTAETSAAAERSVIPRPMSTQGMADAIAARSNAAVALGTKWEALNLDAERDGVALLEFANASQWAAPPLAFRARCRAATLNLERAGDNRTMTRIETSFAQEANEPVPRSVDHLIDALLKFSQTSHRLGDPHPRLDDDGEINCWPFKGEKEIRRILDALARSTDPAASDKIRSTISRRLNDYQVYVSLAPLCEVLGQLGDGRTAAFLKGLVDVTTNAWEYTRDMKRAAARGLAHLLPRDPNLRDELTRIGNQYGCGVAINRVLAGYDLPPISTWDTIGKAAAQNATDAAPWDIAGFSQAIKSYPQEQRISAYAAAAMQFRHKGSRSGAIDCYVAALKEAPVATQSWIWTQLDAVLSHLPKDHAIRVQINGNASGDAGKRAAVEKMVEALAEFRK